MRKMNKLKVTVQGGKQTDKKVVEEGKKVSDSIADYLTHQSSADLQEAKDSGKLKFVTVWTDEGELKREAEAKKKKPAAKKDS